MDDNRVSGGYTLNGTNEIYLTLSIRLHLPRLAHFLLLTRNKLKFDLSFLPCQFSALRRWNYVHSPLCLLNMVQKSIMITTKKHTVMKAVC
ncbi:hypothetical protein BDI_3754 [Parabacteroides distasonis ATCC 8503]|uniref:Uncharacterized protein n=1 Tax=Parabacteroides distasonis (strain ATCC 8503 / DSM 20701 / CIP 104284 / JCM 5825 / NCTC 11152) TaxID=435591 RepID=A6LIC7_PARD8|nr:hypothetical protein BDI_3754 [Parabacteroides distasonis ATCC 8503]